MTSPYTTAEVLAGTDLTGRVSVVTGASSGLWVETATALALRGASVVAAVRDVAKAAAALPHSVITVEMDLAYLNSVRTAATTIAAEYPWIDMLINNAGVMAPPLLHTTQGFELQLGTNLSRHLTRDDFTDLGGLELTDAAHGAATTVWAATSPDLVGHGGAYLQACAVGRPHAHAADPDEAAKLWEWSARVTGTHRHGEVPGQ